MVFQVLLFGTSLSDSAVEKAGFVAGVKKVELKLPQDS